MAEVAGAVEIAPEALQKIETGFERPTEDILMLLISHFDMHEDEATKLWILAGYDRSDASRSQAIEDNSGRSVVMLVAFDARVMYSDGVQVIANKSGVVLNFLQSGGGPHNQQMPAARIGMSYEQTQALLQVLHQTLLDAKHPRPPQGLPAPKPNSKSNHKKTDTN